ncbi:MAG: diguanylate cyclase [Bacillus sp. (in: Bacteria)]|nr:diguanylate cyclase [Bacillus sp. (in: firmicutes)]
MVKDFVSNAALLIASFSIMGQLFKNRPLNFTTSLSTKLYWGLCFGLLGNILMTFSIQVDATIIADLRHLAIVIAASFGGLIPALTAAILIALGRILLFGINETSLLASLGALLLGILSGGISTLNYSRTSKAILMNLIGLFIFSIIFIIKIDEPNLLKQVLTMFYLISIIGGYVAYHFFVFIVNSNEAQNQLKHSVNTLKESEERFRLLAEYSSDMITMHNEKGEYIYISPAVKEIIHFEYHDLLGKKMIDFVHPDDIIRTNEIFVRVLHDGVANLTYRYLSKSGDYIWLESRLKSVHNPEDSSKKVINVSRNITERKLTEQKLQEANELLNRLSYMDGLTGVVNRRYFDETLEKVWSNSANTPLTLLMLDIDYFKNYNDTYGHPTGDLCLQMISQAINDQVNVNLDYSFCRYGGEEFALILPSTTTVDGTKVAKGIQENIQALKIPHISSEIAEIVTISIGIATMVPTSFLQPQTLIQMADSALYLSKTKGRNTISVTH